MTSAQPAAETVVVNDLCLQYLKCGQPGTASIVGMHGDTSALAQRMLATLATGGLATAPGVGHAPRASSPRVWPRWGACWHNR